jgi:small subunit ribosomal protein S16
MVKIRLARQGRKKLPIYKIIAANSRARRDGRFLESLGQYRPANETGKIEINEERVMYWLRTGAQPTDTVRSLLSREGILLKWHLEKKEIEPARAAEIFNTWKTARDEKLANKQSDKERAKETKRKAIEAEKAAAIKAKQDAENAEAEAKAAEAAAEAAATAAPVAEAPAAEEAATAEVTA